MFFGNVESGFAGLVDFADPIQGIHGWILRIDRPNKPVTWDLMAADKKLLSGVASIFREDISAAIGKEALCTLHIAYDDFDEEAVDLLRTADPVERLSVVIPESGEEIAWSVERPTVGWLAINVSTNRTATLDDKSEGKSSGATPPLSPNSAGKTLSTSDHNLNRLLNGMISHRSGQSDARSPNSHTGRDLPAAAEPLPTSNSVKKDTHEHVSSRQNEVAKHNERRCSVTRAADSSPAFGIAFDAAFIYSGLVCVEGWFFGADKINISYDGAKIRPDQLVFFDRPDVTKGYQLGDASARGFLALCAESDRQSIIRGHVEGQPETEAALIFLSESSKEEASTFLAQKRRVLGFILRHVLSNREWIKLVASLIEHAPDLFKKGRAFIEQAKAVPEVGGLLVGWSIAEPPCEIIAVSDDGSTCRLEEAARWNRSDITDAFGAEFGSFTADAGFLLALHGEATLNGTVRLIAQNEDVAYSLASTTWNAAPSDPASFAKWSFALPTESQDFKRRLEKHDGPLIAQLTRRKNEGARKLRIERVDFGPRQIEPHCSLSVPLYGRYDFMLHQMHEMADDLFIRNHAELIYVVDDPRLREAVIKDSHELYRRFGLSFSVIASGVNRGFSAATNLGVQNSSGDYVVLLNSDVIPLSSGWLERMLSAFKTYPGIGAVGARLVYPNGTIQHDGMDFEWEPTLGAHINVHPGMGLPPTPSAPSVVTRKAVTGACVMMERSTYEAVGRLDENFLIGDFEDSDLCLKVRQAGYEIAMIQEVTLVHLERQSFRGIGEDIFRDRVVRYNAWRHEQRWHQDIASLKSFVSRRLGS